MCDVLYRGKRKDNGEWVEGYYTELPIGSLGASIFANDDEIVCEDTASYIIKVFTKQHSNYSNGNPLQVVELEKYEVIPETVGQYINKTDKNGKKIFNDDIVAFKRNGTDFIGSIIFNKDTASFEIRCNDIIGSYGETSIYKVDLSVCDEIEVIGNIHNNPSF